MMKPEKAIRKLEKLGGQVTLDDTGDVTEVYLCMAKFADKHVPILSTFPRLQALNVSETQITDRGVEAISKLTSIQTLEIGYNGITDNGLRHVATMAGLTKLGLDKLNVTFGGLAHIARLTWLETLCLSSIEMADRELSVFAGLTRLRSLNIGSTGVSNASLDVIFGFTKLDRLDIFECQIDYFGVEKIKAHFPDLYLTYDWSGEQGRHPDTQSNEAWLAEPMVESVPEQDDEDQGADNVESEIDVTFGPAEEHIAIRLNKLFAACRSMRGNNPKGYENSRSKLDELHASLKRTPVRQGLIEQHVVALSGGTFHWDP